MSAFSHSAPLSDFPNFVPSALSSSGKVSPKHCSPAAAPAAAAGDSPPLPLAPLLLGSLEAAAAAGSAVPLLLLLLLPSAAATCCSPSSGPPIMRRIRSVPARMLPHWSLPPTCTRTPCCRRMCTKS